MKSPLHMVFLISKITPFAYKPFVISYFIYAIAYMLLQLDLISTLPYMAHTILI